MPGGDLDQFVSDWAAALSAGFVRPRVATEEKVVSTEYLPLHMVTPLSFTCTQCQSGRTGGLLPISFPQMKHERCWREDILLLTGPHCPPVGIVITLDYSNYNSTVLQLEL